MMRRRRGPGLIGTAARTAVVVGTANAVSQKQHQRAQAKATQAEAAQAAAPPAAAPAEPVAATPPAAGEPDYMAELQKLADLHRAGILTDEEFAAKKAQILGL